jgi:hypothetical protein
MNLRNFKLDDFFPRNKRFFLFSIILLPTVLIWIHLLGLLNPLIIILSIITGAVIMHFLYIFNKNPKDVLDNISWLLVITTIFYVIFLVLVSIPFQSKGINNEPLKIDFDFFIVNEEISIQELENYIRESNKIWNKYNVSIKTKSIQNIQRDITENERLLLYTNISNDKSSEENQIICNEEYMPIINKITNNNSNQSIIFILGKGNAGRGSLCGHSFAIFQYEKTWWIDLTSWNLAHEIGHILGLEHPKNYYKLNLMTDKHKIVWGSHFLTQEQIDIVKNRTEELSL